MHKPVNLSTQISILHQLIEFARGETRTAPEGDDRADLLANLHELLLRRIVRYVTNCNQIQSTSGTQSASCKPPRRAAPTPRPAATELTNGIKKTAGPAQLKLEGGKRKP